MYGAMLCRRQQFRKSAWRWCTTTSIPNTKPCSRKRSRPKTLQIFFEEHCAQYATWAQAELEYKSDARPGACRRWVFLSSFIRRNANWPRAFIAPPPTGEHLLAQAPTGVGKTLGTLFPMLKAMGAQKIDRIFYLAAKTTGRELALDALRAMTSMIKLRVLEITAREKVCKYPDSACHGDSCPLAKSFYDRLPGARAEALNAA